MGEVEFLSYHPDMRTRPILLCGLLSLTAACSSGPERRRDAPRPASPLAKAVIRTAKTYLPEEEKDRPKPKDCSDFVQKVFLEHGFRLPRTSAAMSRLGEPLRSSRGLSMADLVFFSGKKGGKGVGHVGIYIGNGLFIHYSNEEAGVSMDTLYNDYYRRRYLKARRILPD